MQNLQDQFDKVIGDPAITSLFRNCGVKRVLVGVKDSVVLVQAGQTVFWWDSVTEQIEVREASSQFPFVGEFELGSNSSEFWNSFVVQFVLSVLS